MTEFRAKLLVTLILFLLLNAYTPEIKWALEEVGKLEAEHKETLLILKVSKELERIEKEYSKLTQPSQVSQKSQIDELLPEELVRLESYPVENVHQAIYDRRLIGTDGIVRSRELDKDTSYKILPPKEKEKAKGDKIRLIDSKGNVYQEDLTTLGGLDDRGCPIAGFVPLELIPNTGMSLKVSKRILDSTGTKRITLSTMVSRLLRERDGTKLTLYTRDRLYYILMEKPLTLKDGANQKLRIFVDLDYFAYIFFGDDVDDKLSIFDRLATLDDDLYRVNVTPDSKNGGGRLSWPDYYVNYDQALKIESCWKADKGGRERVTGKVYQ